MSDLVLRTSDDHAIALPEPRTAVTIRQAEMNDIPFIDDLQKKHSKMVGWFPTKQIEGNIEGGHVLIAVDAEKLTRVGYCISRDKYMKREDCGIIYQLNVAPGKHRNLVGATLIKAVFDRAAYGCKLFCCWCAQDIAANLFWESIGFVPLAFRTGSRRTKKSSGGGPRIHIFWQRRIREGDTETPYWYPSETTGGAVKENRLVLPIPPGTHWSDAKPAVLPGMEKIGEKQLESDSGGRAKRPRKKQESKPVQVTRPTSIKAGGLRFGPPPEEVEAQKAETAKRKAEKKPKQKNDPKLVAAVRELRDRYIEQINEGLLLPPSACGKYDVSRALEAAPSVMKRDHSESRLLDAA